MGAFHSSKTANGAVSASKQLIYREMESLGRHETPWNSISGDPYGTRTRVFAVRGRRPRPLDEGASAPGISPGMKARHMWTRGRLVNQPRVSHPFPARSGSASARQAWTPSGPASG